MKTFLGMTAGFIAASAFAVCHIEMARSLRRAMKQYVAQYHTERNHQGKSNVLLFPQVTETRCDEAVECRDGWAGPCSATTETPRELATKSRSMATSLSLGGPCAETNALSMATTDTELTRR
jgi:hypothetical protein